LALKALGLGDEFKAEEVLEAMDANHDGTIDLDEWLNCMTKPLRIAINSKLNKKDKLDGFQPLINVAAVFDQMDADKSGTLSKDEIKNAMICLGLKAWDVNEFFVGLDEDQNGEISLQEFKDNLPSYVYKAMAQKLNDQGLIEGM
jgi:Ca2+-binding EF-hand superfamily protein